MSSTGDRSAALAATEARLHSPQRLNALADGIFAIAMTLFALDVRRIDDATTQLTVVFLFGIASTPVASNALIRFGSVTRAVIFASVLLAFTSFMHLLVYRHVTDPRLGLSDVDPESRRAALGGSAWVVGPSSWPSRSRPRCPSPPTRC